MAVSGIRRSQQVSAPTPPLKEQNQRATSQHRTPDTLECKNAPASCSFRYCLSRIYDFFCALFRCLFCRREIKPNIPDQPTPSTQPIIDNPEHSQIQPLQTSPTIHDPKEPEDPKAAALEFLDHKDEKIAWSRRNDPDRQRSYFTVVLLTGLSGAKPRFSQLHPKVQDHVLGILTEAELYDTVREYLMEKWLGLDRIEAFKSKFQPKMKVKFGVMSKKECKERSGELIKIFANGFGSTDTSTTA